MKLKLFYDRILKVLTIPAVFKIPHNRIISKFVLDTGSPHTILNYSDSIRLNIPHLQKSELIRIGGRAYQSYLYKNLELTFKSEDGKPVKDFIEVRVLKPASLKMEEIDKLDSFPNLLGLDFLEKGYKLFCNLSNGEIYLEK